MVFRKSPVQKTIQLYVVEEATSILNPIRETNHKEMIVRTYELTLFLNIAGSLAK